LIIRLRGSRDAIGRELTNDSANVSCCGQPVKGNWNRANCPGVQNDDSSKEHTMETYDAHKSTTEVRQGNRRQMNLRVLIISTVIVVVAFAAIWIFFLSQPPGNTIG
jgi:hypothetical protein